MPRTTIETIMTTSRSILINHRGAKSWLANMAAVVVTTTTHGQPTTIAASATRQSSPRPPARHPVVAAARRASTRSRQNRTPSSARHRPGHEHDRTSPHCPHQQPPRNPNTSTGVPGLRPQRRLSINITPIERGGRIAIGLAAMISGLALMVPAGSALAAILELLLIAAGLEVVVTGARGRRPLYQRLDYTPSSVVGRTN